MLKCELSCLGANCPVSYLDGSTDFVVDESWLQAEHDRGGDHEWTGETHFDCDFDQIDEDEAEIYECEEYEPEDGDEPDFVPVDEVEKLKRRASRPPYLPKRRDGTSLRLKKIRSSLYHPNQDCSWVIA